MKRPLISIIVPIYKVSNKYLSQCVDSCINQTYKDIEIILVDDGSPDDCGKICDLYAANDSRIKVIHKKNEGLVSARNAGWEAVSGQWFTFLDGDDWLSTDMCDILNNVIKRNPNAEMIFWKCVFELPHKTVKGKYEWRRPEKEIVYENEDCKELARNVLIYDSGISTAPAKLIKTEFSKEYDISHNSSLRQGIEGYDYCFRAFYNSKKVVYLNEYFYHYRYNEHGISKSVDEKNTKYITDGFKVLWDDINKIPNNEKYMSAFYQRICYVLIAMALNSYYHIDNNDSIRRKGEKFGKIIADNEIYQIAIKDANISDMDKLRKITMWFIKHKMYYMLQIISWTKHLMLKIGYYNY
jgi:glycosyltransferase involved in cell wall biosynthesis